MSKESLAAQVLWDAWQRGGHIDGLDEPTRPTNDAEGWAVQRQLDALAGPRAGWKIAGTSEAGRRHIGIERPIVGTLYASRVVRSGSTVRWPSMHVIEPEFAFRMERDLPAAGAPFTAAQVVAAVGELMPAIEIPDSRFTDFLSVGGPNLIADNACACDAVLGPPAAQWDPDALADHEVVVVRNGEQVASGRGANVLAGPIDALVWLANELALHGWSLSAGEVVITGACAVPQDVSPGDVVTADFGTLGSVTVIIH